MHSDPVFHELKNVLPENDCARVISALRHDSLVWSTLQQPDIFTKALALAGSDARLWNPGLLSVLASGWSVPVDVIREKQLLPIEPNHKKQAALVYEEALRSDEQPNSLAQAGLIALALRERRRVVNSWHGLLAELQHKKSQQSKRWMKQWTTPIACLFSLVPDPSDLLKSLVSDGHSPSFIDEIELVTKVVLCNPISFDEKVEMLSSSVNEISQVGQLIWLRQIEEIGQSKLALLVASNILFKLEELTQSELDNRQDQQFIRTELSHLEIERVYSQYYRARMIGISGDYPKSEQLLKDNLKTVSLIYAQISNQLADISIQADNFADAISTRKKVLEICPSSESAYIDLAFDHLMAGDYSLAENSLPTNSYHAAIPFIQMQVALRKEDRSLAKDYAIQLVQKIKTNESDTRQYSFIPSRLGPHELIQVIASLDLIHEAVDVGDILLEFFPDDARILNEQSVAYQQIGDVQAAKDKANIAVLLNPDNASYRRDLAENLQACKQWKDAFEEWSIICNKNSQYEEPDYISMLQCAVKADLPDRAIEISLEILEKNNNSGMAHYLLGEAQVLKKDYQEGNKHFIHATLLSPGFSDAWLALSQTYQDQNEHQKAIDTLRSASQASPGSANIQFRLGELYLQENSPSDALPFLRRAVSLDPKSIPQSLVMASTLLDLGFNQEAREVLDEARQLSQFNPELAYLHAKSLISIGDKHAALSPLKIVLESNPETAEPYLLYARLMNNSIMEIERGIQYKSGKNLDLLALEAWNNYQFSSAAIERILEIDPNQIEAKILLAENLAGIGKVNDALDLFLSLAETQNNDETDLSWRIKFGLGKATLAVGQTETALAALQEAASAKPEDILIMETLAEAYLAANLIQDALQTGRSVLRLAPDNVDVISWFAGLTYNIGIYPETITALERAIELNPQSASLYLKLVQVHLKINNLPNAHAILDQVLSLRDMTSIDWQQTAHMWLTVGDKPKAIVCLEKAIERDQAVEFYVELAKILQETGELDLAFEAIQKASNIHPQDARLLVALSDLYQEKQENQSALTSLDQALQVLPGPLEYKHVAQYLKSRPGFPPISEPNLLNESVDTAFIHLLTAELLRNMGDCSNALNHAGIAVEIKPRQPEARVLAADLACNLLQYDQAKAYAEWSQNENSVTSNNDGYVNSLPEKKLQEIMVANLLCIRAEVDLETGDSDHAKAIVNHAEAFAGNLPRLLALQARLSYMDGDFVTADQLLASAIDNLDNTPAGLPNTPQDMRNTTSPKNRSAYPTLSIAQAALELHQWNTAIALFQQGVRNQPHEPFPYFALARALTIGAEYYRLTQELRIRVHSPGEEKISEGSYELFEKAVTQAGQLCPSPEIDRWNKRGKAAFHPTLQNATDLANLPKNPFDVAALMAVLRQNNHHHSAIEISADFPYHPAVLLQLALTLKDENPIEGFFASRSLVGQQPGNPIHQVTHAILASEAEEIETALNAIKCALEVWNDEPEWHLLAADFYSNIGDHQLSLSHRKNAYDLDKENPQYAVALGQAYLDQGDPTQALIILEQASLTHQNVIDIWLAIAKAYKNSGDLVKAISYAQKGIAVAPNQIRPKLVCAELALEAQQYPLAQSQAKFVLEIDPQNAEAVQILARSLSLLGAPQDALKLIETALPQTRDVLPLELERIILLKQLKGAAASLEALQSLDVEYPGNSRLLALLAEALAETNQNESAERAAQASLVINPDQPKVHLLAGRLLRITGRFDQAINHLQESIRNSPKDIEVHLELGRTFQDNRDHEQALHAYKQATQINPKDPRPYYQAGLVLKEGKDYVNAESMLRKAAQLAPEDLNIRRQLGAIIALNLVHNLQETSH